jgi:hypothetical protein
VVADQGADSRWKIQPKISPAVAAIAAASGEIQMAVKFKWGRAENC